MHKQMFEYLNIHIILFHIYLFLDCLIQGFLSFFLMHHQLFIKYLVNIAKEINNELLEREREHLYKLMEKIKKMISWNSGTNKALIWKIFFTKIGLLRTALNLIAKKVIKFKYKQGAV